MRNNLSVLIQGHVFTDPSLILLILEDSLDLGLSFGGLVRVDGRYAVRCAQDIPDRGDPMHLLGRRVARGTAVV